MAVKNCFIRGSVVRYVQLPAEHIDTQLLEDATRRGAFRVAPKSTRVLMSSKFQRLSIKTNDNDGYSPCKSCIPKSFNMVRFSVAMKSRPILQNKF